MKKRPLPGKQTWLPTKPTPKEDKTKNNMSKGKEPIFIKSEDPHAILGPEKRKNERETVEEKEETVSSQPCKRKRLTEVLKAHKPSPAKTDSCNPFHNRTQDRTKERENWTVLDLGGLVHLEMNSDPQYIGALNVPMRLPKLPSHNNNRAEKSFQAFKLSDNKPRMGRRHRAPWSASKKSFWVFLTLRQWSPQVKAATKCYNRAEKSFQAFKLSDNKPRMGRRHRAPWSAAKKSFWVFITLRQWSPQVKAATKCYNRAEKSFQAFKLSDNKPRMGRRHRAPWSAAKSHFECL